ncbi:MAG: DUF4469 domain-containing protein [Leptospirales bacterium]|nr:DUF4469 domain-containing protein [Leptospirales bacterium]
MTTYLHKIKAQLYDNVLTDDPNDFVARVISEKSLNTSDICESAVERGGADVSAPAMEHAVNLFLKEMAYRLCDGFSVNTGWFNAQANIKGVFNSPTEHYNNEKHNLSFAFHQGALLRKKLSEVEVSITGVAEPTLHIAQVTDVRTGSVNDQITPNLNLKIAGSRLKIAGEAAANGVYFLLQDKDNPTRTKVEANDMVVNNPSELIVVTPDLAPGVYKLEVVTQYSTGGSGKQFLKEPRIALFDRVLTVI